MRYFLIIFFLLISINSFAAPGVWRWYDVDNKKGENSFERKAVKYIDIGEVRISDKNYIHSYSLLCVDGVKVLTTTMDYQTGNVHSIIIPGPCSGPAIINEEQKQETQVQHTITPSGRVKVDW